VGELARGKALLPSESRSPVGSQGSAVGRVAVRGVPLTGRAERRSSRSHGPTLGARPPRAENGPPGIRREGNSVLGVFWTHPLGWPFPIWSRGRGTWGAHFSWTFDLGSLRATIDRARLALRSFIAEHHTQAEGVVLTSWVGRDRSSSAGSARTREVANRILWSAGTGRFAACVDADGLMHDYGFTSLSLEAARCGFATPEQAQRSAREDALRVADPGWGRGPRFPLLRCHGAPNRFGTSGLGMWSMESHSSCRHLPRVW
jgi:hypothetical protein